MAACWVDGYSFEYCCPPPLGAARMERVSDVLHGPESRVPGRHFANVPPENGKVDGIWAAPKS